ncbi:MAG: iron chelate uptake ABC transporter family permease subunit, partial [Caulobacterales bacterium]
MRLILLLIALLAAVLALAMAFGETALTLAQYSQAIFDPHSPASEIIFGVRAPRAATAALVGAALGLSGAVMQGLLRNPLADPGVLGVSAAAGLGASAAIALGLAAHPGGLEAAALAGALGAGALVAFLAARFREPETLILFGVSLSALGGALTALILNLSPTPVFADDVLKWLLGSAADRDWSDLGLALAPMGLGAALCAYAA